MGTSSVWVFVRLAFIYVVECQFHILLKTKLLICVEVVAFAYDGADVPIGSGAMATVIG